MKYRAISDRARQISTETAVGQHRHLQGCDPACVVKTHAVVVPKRMALAGDHEVFIAVKPQLDGAFELEGRNSRPNGHLPSLRFFAAKAAAHAPAFNHHPMVVNP